MYVCTNCGETSPRWLGKCPSCGEWNTLAEDIVKVQKTASQSIKQSTTSNFERLALQDVDTNEEASRIVTHIGELDRVLGGGIVIGSVVLIGGAPGAGKSTLLLQLCGQVGALNKPILYITGEESAKQIKLRANRLDVAQENIWIAAQNDMDEIIQMIEQSKPALVIIDSIQTMRTTQLSSAIGSVSQVKECTTMLREVAKKQDIPIFIVGHVNKDGAIAGPKVMEHIVDTVLYFEGDRTLPYKVLRAAKNRYGSTNEIGMFDMTSFGLMPIENPSEMLLEGRSLGTSGNCVACVLEGTRPILAEIQALAAKSNFGTPRRAVSGIDSSRTNLLLAVLEKREGYFLGNLDVYLNVVGGLTLDETACDLSVCLAVVSSLVDKPLPDKLLAIGEVGLGGEIRNVAQIDTRLREAQRIGFTKAIVPKQSLRYLNTDEFNRLKIEGVSSLGQAIKLSMA